MNPVRSKISKEKESADSQDVNRTSSGMKEWHRTVILILLIAIAIGFIIWTRQSYETNFLQSL